VQDLRSAAPFPSSERLGPHISPFSECAQYTHSFGHKYAQYKPALLFCINNNGKKGDFLIGNSAFTVQIMFIFSGRKKQKKPQYSTRFNKFGDLAVQILRFY
jgi:hypothetical protein